MYNKFAAVKQQKLEKNASSLTLAALSKNFARTRASGLYICRL